jgi:RNA polymerase sigma-70 factor (sigma-E family)
MALPVETAVWPERLASLHREHYRSLVRLASLLLGDVGTSEEVVQDAFVRLQVRRSGPRDPERAAAYLRTAVINGARSQIRRRNVRERYLGRRTVAPWGPSAEAGALIGAEQQRVLAALECLPDRQREAIALRFYLDLSEADIAAAMKVTPGSVKTHIHRGLATLSELLEEQR